MGLLFGQENETEQDMRAAGAAGYLRTESAGQELYQLLSSFVRQHKADHYIPYLQKANRITGNRLVMPGNDYWDLSGHVPSVVRDIFLLRQINLSTDNFTSFHHDGAMRKIFMHGMWEV